MNENRNPANDNQTSPPRYPPLVQKMMDEAKAAQGQPAHTWSEQEFQQAEEWCRTHNLRNEMCREHIERANYFEKELHRVETQCSLWKALAIVLAIMVGCIFYLHFFPLHYTENPESSDYGG